MKTLNVLRSILQLAIDNIDNGTCSLSEEELGDTIDLVQQLVNPGELLSKYQVADKLKCSEKTVDNLVKAGKLPEGKKLAGITAKLWYKSDINNYIENENNL